MTAQADVGCTFAARETIKKKLTMLLQDVAPKTTHSLDLDELNQRFADVHPIHILAWCLENLRPGLIQSSAFNVNGMAIMHMLYQIAPNPPMPVLFLDTLHHFPETLALVREAQKLYELDLHVYRVPDADSRESFAARYGESLWKTDFEQYHYLTKVEPLQRGLHELGATAWITGRRRDQSATRSHTPIFERDKHGRLKINPLASWTRQDVWKYIMRHNVLYNPLHDRGYPSIGDEPTTTPVGAGEDERAGRWRGMGRTECGIHL
ncbi:phosphoadenosine phosphosulfate reductase [Gloeocapsopsis dulcis]|nr:phosphoadenosine phosphosulfate reductase [Gloeocapsopsis dulcis]